MRDTIRRIMLGLALLAPLTTTAPAQDYPNRPVKIVGPIRLAAPMT